MKPKRGTWVIIVSLFCAVLLTIMPLPEWAAWARPVWVLMVLAYWVLALEQRVSVGIAWLLGLLMDSLGGTIFGEHALALCIIIYIVAKLQRQIRVAPLLQQAFFMAILTFIYLLILFLAQGLVQHIPATWMFWLPILSTALLWPWLFIILRDCRRRFRVT